MIRNLSVLTAIALFVTAAPVLLRADVTIRYAIETSIPMMPKAGESQTSVIYMKGNKGVTVNGTEIMIADFSRQQITIVDTARKRFATIAAADYAAKMGTAVSAAMPEDLGGIPGVGEMLKGLKTTCDTKDSDAAEIIQGVQSVRHEVTCNMTMAMPDSVKETMPSMSMKIVSRTWSASPGERVRVPGLWQLSGYEVWQNYFMNPTGRNDGMSKIFGDSLKPLMEAFRRDQSAILRSTMEMSMHMPMPGMPAGDTSFMTMKTEMTGLSTELLDDSLFAVPSDCSEEPFESVMKGITDAVEASAKGRLNNRNVTSPAESYFDSLPSAQFEVEPIRSPASATPKQ